MRSDPIMTLDMATQQYSAYSLKGRPSRDFWPGSVHHSLEE